jgi:hypothetical protein
MIGQWGNQEILTTLYILRDFSTLYSFLAFSTPVSYLFPEGEFIH